MPLDKINNLKTTLTATKKLAILNLSPDSFSDAHKQNSDPNYSISKVLELISSGADFIDIGGESTRPEAQTVSMQEELKRLKPFIENYTEKTPLSLDSRNPETIKNIFENYGQNFAFLNDISGLQNPELVKVIAEYINPSVKLIAMHSYGKIPPLKSSEIPDDYYKEGLLEHMQRFFEQSIKLCNSYGIDSSRIVLDPGLGFGKNLKHSLEIVDIVPKLKAEFGLEILIGASRKSFLKLWKNKEEASISELDQWTTEYHNLFTDIDYCRVHKMLQC